MTGVTFGNDGTPSFPDRTVGWWDAAAIYRDQPGSSDAFATVNTFINMWKGSSPPRATLVTLDQLDRGDLVIYGTPASDPLNPKYPYGYHWDHIAMVVDGEKSLMPIVASRGGYEFDPTTNEYTCYGGLIQPLRYDSKYVQPNTGADRVVMGLKIDYSQH